MTKYRDRKKKLDMTTTKSKASSSLGLEQALLGIQKAIVKLDPNGATSDDTSWQERKSGETRIALLEAAVTCLADHGYSKTTSQLVAASAGISRGAMLHHYATKADLIAGTIDYIMYKRMETFYREVSKLSDKERVEETQGIEIYWNAIQTSEYQAYLEISMASRTDEALRKVFDEKAHMFYALWFDQTPMIFPEWSGQSKEKLELASDILISTLEGLSLNRRILESKDRRLAVRKVLSTIVATLRDGS